MLIAAVIFFCFSLAFTVVPLNWLLIDKITTRNAFNLLKQWPLSLFRLWNIAGRLISKLSPKRNETLRYAWVQIPLFAWACLFPSTELGNVRHFNGIWRRQVHHTKLKLVLFIGVSQIYVCTAGDTVLHKQRMRLVWKDARQILRRKLRTKGHGDE